MPDIGGISFDRDQSTALSQALINRHKPFLSKMPWEGEIMDQILSDAPRDVSLGMPSSWRVDSERLETWKARATDIDGRVTATVHRNFIEARKFDIKRGLAKLSFFSRKLI